MTTILERGAYVWVWDPIAYESSAQKGVVLECAEITDEDFLLDMEKSDICIFNLLEHGKGVKYKVKFANFTDWVFDFQIKGFISVVK